MKRIIPFLFTLFICVRVSAQEDTKLYPNPAADFFQISNSFDEVLKVELYNSLGVRVLVSEELNRESKIMIKDLPRGRYFVKVSFRQTTDILNLIVK